jgi:hypothetical protein
MAPSKVKALIIAILNGDGNLTVSQHALKEMRDDAISMVELEGTLRGGVVEPGELERGSWRYRVRRRLVYVVITFHAEDNAIIVTAWRRKR